MRILHVLDSSIPAINGYCLRSKYIIEGQKEAGIFPIVVTGPKHRPKISGMVEIFNGITYYRTLMPQGFFTRFAYLNEAGIIGTLKKRILEVIEKERVDLIHAHSPSLCGYAAALAAHKKNIPFVYEVRALWEDAAVDQKKYSRNSLKYKAGRLVETQVFKKADIITTIAAQLKEDIVSRGISADKVILCPNGVDTGKFLPRQENSALRQKYNLNGAICIGFIGSFFRFEGIEFLVEALPSLLERAKGRAIKLLLVGEGETYKKVKELVHKNSLEQSVILTGNVPHEQILDYYSIMDILVYPRLSERVTELVTPLKILEAMSMAKAIVGSDVGGIREIMKDDSGLLFKAQDKEDLVTKIMQFVSNPQMIAQYGRSARNFVEKEKDWRVLIKKYLSIYTTLLEERQKI